MVVLSPQVLPWILPRPPLLAEMVGVMGLPMAAAFFRTESGYRQLEAVCGGRPTAWRQATLAGAIIVLLVFEALSNGLQFAGGHAPAEAWCTAIGAYLVYLGLVAVALHRPHADGQRESRPAEGELVSWR